MPSLNPVRTKQIKTERRILLIKLLGGKCVDCGATDRLEFDHIDPNSVSFRIGHRLDYSMKTLRLEAKKCQLLCKSCHIIKSYTERGFKAAEHGTASMYKNNGCRCLGCKKAWTIYFTPKCKIYRARKRLVVINSS